MNARYFPCLTVNGLASSRAALGSWEVNVKSGRCSGVIRFGGIARDSRRSRLFVVFRARTTNGQRPVLQRQPFHAAELGGVVRDEPEPKTACVSGYEEIVGADHLAPCFQVSTDLRIVN